MSPEKGIDAPKEIETKDPIIPKEMEEIEMEKEKEMARLQAALAPKVFQMGFLNPKIRDTLPSWVP